MKEDDWEGLWRDY